MSLNGYIELVTANNAFGILLTEHWEFVNSKMWKGDDGKWACSECDYSSKKNSNVYEHIEAKHIQGPGYFCQECEKTCPTRKALRHHLARYHPKPRVGCY